MKWRRWCPPNHFSSDPSGYKARLISQRVVGQEEATRCGHPGGNNFGLGVGRCALIRSHNHNGFGTTQLPPLSCSIQPALFSMVSAVLSCSPALWSDDIYSMPTAFNIRTVQPFITIAAPTFACATDDPGPGGSDDEASQQQMNTAPHIWCHKTLQPSAVTSHTHTWLAHLTSLTHY
jgi:hypothetical protein